jgi:hypothetical protein
MMAAMRRWLLILLVLLLPLRVLVGSAMAGQMLQHGQPGTRAVQQGHHTAKAQHAPGPGHDCEHAVQPAGDARDEAQPQAGGDCPTCASCQVCSSVALFPDSFQAPVAGFSQPPPQAVQRSYASAEPFLAFKPPRR